MQTPAFQSDIQRFSFAIRDSCLYSYSSSLAILTLSVSSPAPPSNELTTFIFSCPTKKKRRFSIFSYTASIVRMVKVHMTPSLL